MILLSQSDFAGIGVVAVHCDLTKLGVAENHALQYDLSQLYCSFWSEVLIYWNEIIAYQALYSEYELAVIVCDENPECTTPPTPPTIPENYDLKLNLINGGSYENCAGKPRNHAGARTVLVNYAYARYVILNGFNDTSTGIVTKTDSFSIPKTLKELEQFADMYRNMGKITFENTLSFLCANKTTFTDFDAAECKYNCGCGTDKCGGTKAKGYGLRSSNVRKQR